VFKILDELPDKKTLMLFKHRFLRDIHNNFASYGSGLPRAEALDYISASVARCEPAKDKTGAPLKTLPKPAVNLTVRSA
jgi:hypothetical protein